MRSTSILVLALSLAGCNGGAGTHQAAPAPAATPVAITEPVPTHGTFQPFATGETVDALAFGMAPAIDSTEALKAALGTGNRTVRVPAGDYNIGATVLPSNTILELAPGAVLHEAGLAPAICLLQVRGNNVRIVGHGAAVVSAGYNVGEHRCGVLMFGAHNVSIEGLESSGHAGDGFYVGGNSRDISITGVLADRNRRNGLSITSGIDVFVADSVFSNSKGTLPEFGVDVEPNSGKDPLMGLVLLRLHTPGNVKGGLAVYLSAYAGGAVVDLLIADHSGGKYDPQFVRATDQVRYIKTR